MRQKLPFTSYNTNSSTVILSLKIALFYSLVNISLLQMYAIRVKEKFFKCYVGAVNDFSC